MDKSRWAAPGDILSNMSRSGQQTPDEDDLFASTPPKHSSKQTPGTHQGPKTLSTQSQLTPAVTGADDGSRDAALRAELESIRRINGVIEGVTTSLDKARGNMGAITQTVQSSHTLLDTWTRILSQTEHNQRLILNPAWFGATQDLQDAENETQVRARERQRREAEEVDRRVAAEERRRAEVERRREEAERKEAGSAAGVRPASGARGRGRGMGRGVGGRATQGGRGGAGDVATTPGRTAAGGSAAKVGRGANVGYGRVGSAGTKTARGRGREVS